MLPRGGYKSFLKGKFRSLLVPYVLWTIIATVLAQPVIVANNLLAHRPLLDRSVFDILPNIPRFVDAMFGVAHSQPMHLGVLWYVRALMLLFLFAPIWKFMARKSLAWILLCGWLATVIMPGAQRIDCIDFLLEFGAYFFLGMAIAVYAPRSWIMENCQSKATSYRLPDWVSWSFWLYCSHNIVLMFIIPPFHLILGKGNVAVAITTVIAIFIATFGAIGIAYVIKRLFPKGFKVLNGGR